MFGNIRAPQRAGMFFMKGTIRAFGEIALGIFCYEVCEWFKKFKLTAFSRILLTVFEYGVFIFVILYTNTEHYDKLDGESVLLMAAAVTVSGSGASLLAEPLARLKFMPYLGKMSMMMFMNHWMWLHIFKAINPQMSDGLMIFIYVLCALFSSGVCWIVTDLIKKAVNKNRMKIRRLFLIF